jgi:uncharacterized protein (DUF2141 family)
MALAVLMGGTEPVRAEQGASSGSASLNITVRGIKSSKGVIRLAICPRNAGFPDCKGREVRSASLPIQNGEATIRFTDLPAATYAISVFHDGNANGKLDTFLGIPKEGYGFSRNPPFRPRAPRFAEVELLVSGAMTETIMLRYIL